VWNFKAEQKTYDIGGVKIGGIPGKNPTVLIGTIFHSGHKVIKNEKTGDFDKELAEDEIKVQEEYSDKTGNPCMLDVVGGSPDIMK